MKCLITKDGLLKDPNQGDYADDNEVYSFKGRTIDLEQPIRIFRNLNKKGTWYSVRQGTLTVAHAKAICVRDCKFIVNEKVRDRVAKNKKKEVHAFIEGMYAINGMGTTAKKNDLPAEIKYNPYFDKYFKCNNLTTKPYYVSGAMFVICNGEGVKAAYTYGRHPIEYA